MMMEPAEDWNRDDTPDLLSPTKIWSIFQTGWSPILEPLSD